MGVPVESEFQQWFITAAIWKCSKQYQEIFFNRKTTTVSHLKHFSIMLKHLGIIYDSRLTFDILN